MHQIPFCPNKDCGYHRQAPTGTWYVAAGFYLTKSFGKVQRFRCRACSTYFSAGPSCSMHSSVTRMRPIAWPT